MAKTEERCRVLEAKRLLRAKDGRGPPRVRQRSPKTTCSSEGAPGTSIHTYSGYENKVKTNLEQRIKSMDAADLIFRVVVPTVDEIEIRDGQRRTVPRKIFPGYVLVQMITLRAGRRRRRPSRRSCCPARAGPSCGTRPASRASSAPAPRRRRWTRPRCADPEADARRGAAWSRSASSRPERPHHRRAVRGLRRHGRRDQLEKGKVRVAGVLLRPRDAGGAGLPAGRAAVAGQPVSCAIGAGR